LNTCAENRHSTPYGRNRATAHHGYDE
jgi:hypothetical protein